MSIGGLLASALGGAAQSGAAMADKIGTEKRENKKQAGLLSDKNNREDLIRVENKQDAKDAADLKWERDKELSTTNHNRAMALASQKNRNTGSNKIDPRIKQRVDVLTKMIGSDTTETEDRTKYVDELNSLTGFSTPSSSGTEIPVNREESLIAQTDVNGGKQKPPEPLPKWKQLKQQEDEAKAAEDAANKAAIDAESKQIGSTLQANNPVANEAPSETERKRSEAEAIINKVKSGGRILSHELNLLRRYNVPAEILEEASRKTIRTRF